MSLLKFNVNLSIYHSHFSVRTEKVCNMEKLSGIKLRTTGTTDNPTWRADESERACPPKLRAKRGAKVEARDGALTFACMRCFAERSGAKYGRATAGANRIYCVVRPER